MQLSQNTAFLKQNYKKAVFPCMLSILSANINVIVDGILVGQKLGEDALAAINLCLPLYLFFCVIGSLITAGTSIAASNEIGKGNIEKGTVYYRMAFNSSLVISALLTVFGLIFYKNISSVLCSDAAILPYVYSYVFISFVGVIPKIMIYLPAWYLRLDGKNNEAATVMSIMTFGNIVLDFLMIYALDLKVFGAGLASVLSTTVAMVVGFIYLHSKDSAFTIKFCFEKDMELWKNVAKLGASTALNNLFSAFKLLMINTFLMSIGGTSLVAVFTAVNGVSGFAECITLGIPQACSPMLGVFAGEKDNESAKLLLKVEFISGFIYSMVFGILLLLFSPFIRMMYGLGSSLFIPLLCLALANFPALICMIMSGYYNMMGHDAWSWLILFSRLILMLTVSLYMVQTLGLNPFCFLFLSEVLSLLLYLGCAYFYGLKRSDLTKILFMDEFLEKGGKVLNFSVKAQPEEICNASEKISSFCAVNGLPPKQTMALQLSLEEILTLIVIANKDKEVPLNTFDLRAYSYNGIHGIRVRYSGLDFNPFKDLNEADEMNMGVCMVKKIVQSIDYRKVFGCNNLKVELKNE